MPVYHQQRVRPPLEVVQGCPGVRRALDVPHVEDLLSSVLESSRDRNARRSLDLVACEHPHLDAGRAQGLDDQGNVSLQFIYSHRKQKSA